MGVIADKLELMYLRTTAGSAAQKLSVLSRLIVFKIVFKPQQSFVGSNR
jgi:hypothetical protein